jgi:predicted nucleic acid-binding protein
MRVFLDANILLSAAKSDGAVRRLLELLLARGHACWVDGYVVEEARRNLAAKFPEGVAALERQLAAVHVATGHPSSDSLVAGLPLPEKDRPVLAAAIHLRCDGLLTGDRSHFGALYGLTIRGVTIHSPRSLAEWLLGRDS